jgi:hypothetical protein
MSIGLVNLVMLLGMGAVAIPLIIHLLNRRRYRVVDWGAMQFLQISTTRRRKLFLEEVLLMMLRMGLVALLVLALAAPYAAGPLVAQFASRPGRDVVLVIDGSASMARDDGQNVTPYEAARSWAARLLTELSPGDTIAVVLARHQPVPLVGQPTHDLATAADVIARLPTPRGGCDGPRAVDFAVDLLRQHGQHTEQDIIVVTDGQRSGWFDANSLARWKKLGQEMKANKDSRGGIDPRLWLVSVPEQAAPGQGYPNYYLAPLQSAFSHIWRYQPARFETTVLMKGPASFTAPYKIQLLIDGKIVDDLPMPEAPWNSGQVPLAFKYAFPSTGSHLLSVVVRPDPPPEQRLFGHVLKDYLAADNRCDLAVVVGERLHILLVDGDEEITPESSTASLRKAFSAAETDHPSAVVAAKVSYKNFAPAQLTAAAKGGKPQVLVLADVPSLDATQRQAVEQFLAQGGRVLVSVGERISDPSFYNLDLFQDGKGWLPAKLEKVAGDRADPEKAAAIEVSDLKAPLGIFREKPKGGLAQARFPQWWRLSPPAKGAAAVLAPLTTGDPFLVEKSFGKGRVLLCAVPLDQSWGSNLPTFPEYPVLVHELIYYLADTTSVAYNVAPGQPLRFVPEDWAGEKIAVSLPTTVQIERPDGSTESVPVAAWPFIYDKTADAGVYRLHLPGDRTVYYVVESDRQESDLTLAGEAERQALQTIVPVRYEDDPHRIGLVVIGPEHRDDIWWIFMLGVIVLLCLEILLTRRMVARREG